MFSEPFYTYFWTVRTVLNFFKKKVFSNSYFGVFVFNFTCLFLFVKACPIYVDRAHTHAAVEAVSAVAAAEQPEGWRFVPDTILPGYQWAPQWVPARTPTVHWGPISGKAVGGQNTVQHSRSQCEKYTKYGCGAMSIQGKSFGKKSTVDESLLCYGGPRDEEVDETIHEKFDEKEKMKHEIKKSVKDGARSTKEGTLTSSENKTEASYQCGKARFVNVVTDWWSNSARIHRGKECCPGVTTHLSFDSVGWWNCWEIDHHIQLVWRSWTQVMMKWLWKAITQSSFDGAEHEWWNVFNVFNEVPQE